MAANVWNNLGGDGLASTAGNWSLGHSPQATDDIIFDNTSVVNCRWDVSVTINSLDAQAIYTGHLDFSQDNNDLNITGNFTLDCTTVSMGSGTFTFGGDFDNDDVNTWNKGTATIVAGTDGCTVHGSWSNQIYSFTVNSGITCTQDGAGKLFDVDYDLTIYGTFTINEGCRCTGSLRVKSGGKIDGSGYMQMAYCSAGQGLVEQAGPIECTAFYWTNMSNTNVIMVPCTLDVTNFKIYTQHTISNHLIFSAGTYNFNCNVELETTKTIDVDWNAATNNPDINIAGNFITDKQSTGAININMGSGTTTISGGTITFVGSTVTKGTSTLKLTGTTNIFWPTDDLHNIEIDTTGNVTLNAGSPTNCDWTNNFVCNGTFVTPLGLKCRGRGVGTVTVGASGSLTGGGIFQVKNHNINNSAGGTIDVANLKAYVDLPASTTTKSFLGSCDSATLEFRGNPNNGVTHTWRFGSNATFTGNVSHSVEPTYVGTVGIDHSTNNSNITYQGDVTLTENSGSISYSKGTGTITVNGAGDQTFTVLNKDLETIDVDKASGALIFADAFTSTKLKLTQGECQMKEGVASTFTDFEAASATILKSASDGNQAIFALTNSVAVNGVSFKDLARTVAGARINGKDSNTNLGNIKGDSVVFNDVMIAA